MYSGSVKDRHRESLREQTDAEASGNYVSLNSIIICPHRAPESKGGPGIRGTSTVPYALEKKRVKGITNNPGVSRGTQSGNYLYV